MTKVRIPPTLRAEVGGVREVEASGATMRDVFDDLAERFPGLGAQVLSNGDIAPFVNVYLNNEDVRTLQGLDTPVSDGSTVILLPAMAGGQIPIERRASVGRLERPRARRLDAAGRALPAQHEPRGQDLRQARRAEPDRLDQGPRREDDDRDRRGAGRARARP